MAREKKKKIIDIKLIIGILFLLILLVGASYAYFAVEVNSTDYNKTVITGSTEGVAVASIQNPTTKLNLNVDGSAMSQNTLGTIYADDEENYVKTKSEGFHDIGIITLTNSKKDDNIYRCTANVTITVDNGNNSILSVLEKDDLKVFIRWGTNHQVIDLSELQNTNGEITIPISLNIVGNNSKSIETYIELTNKETDQSYISGKDINIDIDTTDLKCELTGEKAVYLTSNLSSGNYYRNDNYINNIKNIYFVDYINDNINEKTNWDLTNIGTKEHQSPAGSIIGWLEEIPKTTDEAEQYYDLYIGSEDRIYATSLFRAICALSEVENIYFDNLRTDIVSDMSVMFWHTYNLSNIDISNFDTSNVVNINDMFNGASSIKELNLSNFNTKNVINMYNMFNGANSIVKLDISNFNTKNVTNMSGMFNGVNNLEELDVSSFNTEKVINMARMFGDMKSLKKLNLNNFYTSKITDMNWMFARLTSLTELTLPSFDTSNVTTLEHAFCVMTNLEKLDIGNFDTSKVTNMGGMFEEDRNLKYLDMRNAELCQITNYAVMFKNVSSEITIIVKDEKNKEWMQNIAPNGAEILTVKELNKQ